MKHVEMDHVEHASSYRLQKLYHEEFQLVQIAYLVEVLANLYVCRLQQSSLRFQIPVHRDREQALAAEANPQQIALAKGDYQQYSHTGRTLNHHLLHCLQPQ